MHDPHTYLQLELSKFQETEELKMSVGGESGSKTGEAQSKCGRWGGSWDTEGDGEDPENS